MLDDNSDFFRKEFFELKKKLLQGLANSISKTKNNKSIQETLFNSSLVMESSIFKSKELNDVFRILVLKNEISKNRTTNLTYSGSKKNISDALQNFCEDLKIKYQWSKNYTLNYLFDKIYQSSLIFILRAILIFIKVFFSNFSLRKCKKPKWHKSEESIFFLSYFIHLNKSSYEKGDIVPSQWGELPKKLISWNLKLNWIHHFNKNPMTPNNSEAIKVLNHVNRKKSNLQSHYFIESYLDLKIMLKSFVDYTRCCFYFLISKHKLNNELKKKNLFWIWPLFKSDWKNSTIGPVSMGNIIFMHLFDKALSDIPKQKTGLYLCENQGWERIFINSWRSNNHGELIGVVHSTISYWDLRYFDNQNHLTPKWKPDTIAVNGRDAFDKLTNSGLSSEKLKKVEALRYMHLKKYENTIFKINNRKNENLNILILGDIQKVTTYEMLNCLYESDKFSNYKYNILFKPHPGNVLDTSCYVRKGLKITYEFIDDLLPTSDIIITSVFTSAALDVYFAQKKVIIFLSPDQLNYSILKKYKSVDFISSSDTLYESISNYLSDANKGKINPNDFFYLSSDLSGWKELFKTCKNKIFFYEK